MSKKKSVGRPKHPLTETMYYRCTLKERFELEDAAEENGRSKSEEAHARCFPKESK